jgi:chemotaxis protein methyltransferase CheR
MRSTNQYNAVVSGINQATDSEPLYRSLIEANLDPLAITSADGKITDMNVALANIIGISREMICDSDLRNYFTEPHKVLKLYEEVLTQRSVAKAALTLRHKNGKLTDALFIGSVYNDDYGNVMGVLIVARDVVERKKTENKFHGMLEAVYQKYGYDFREYSEAHIKRRIMNRMSLSGVKDIPHMQSKVLNDEAFAFELLQDLSITVTEMFRDPEFYRALRVNVIPILKTYPFIKIWHAGCATGEEAYSMAILLHEEGLYDRTTIYATDFNQHVLNRAKAGIFSNKMMKEYTNNYQLSGGKESFSSYYTSDSDNVIMNQSLKNNIVWANHNLVTDSVFAEVHMILCRNVLIYFDRNLQNKVQNLFHASLTNGGVLGLGNKESLRFTELHLAYSELDKKQRIFKKKY